MDVDKAYWEKIRNMNSSETWVKLWDTLPAGNLSRWVRVKKRDHGNNMEAEDPAMTKERGKEGMIFSVSIGG